MMRNTQYPSNTLSVLEVQARLRDLLPRTWDLYLEQVEFCDGPDAVFGIEAPDGRRATLAVKIKRRLDPRDVPLALEQIRAWANLPEATEATVSSLVAAPYLGERTRSKLRESGLSYLDLTGNTHLLIDEPAIYLSAQGADKDPDRTVRPTRSFRGVKTARIVRVLVDYRGPLGVRQIAEIAQTDPGNVSRVLSMLEREDLIGRTSQGGVRDVDWDALLRAWARDYSLLESNKYFKYLDPRGLGNFMSRLPVLAGQMRYAISGSFAAARRAPVAPSRLAVVYVDDAAAAAEVLDLVPAEAGANVLLVEPRDSLVFEGVTVDEGITYAAPSQVVADLLTGTGRNPAEAEELLDWMRRNENEWRA